MSAARRPEGRGRAGPRRLPRSGREPGSGCGRRASRRGHARLLCSAPRAAGDCGCDRPSAPRPAPPRARPLRAGRPAPGPAPGRRPPAAALPAAASDCGARSQASFSACRDLLGYRRPTDLASPQLRQAQPAGAHRPVSRTGASRARTRASPAAQPTRTRPHPCPRCARGGRRRGSACGGAVAATSARTEELR